MNYNRYKPETGEYWGSTDREGDDPTCNYVNDDLYPLPFYDVMILQPYWIGDGWELRPLMNEE